MRFILIVLMSVMLLSCKDNMAGPIKGGTIITLEGDTIEFYGGYLTNRGFGYRGISDVAFDEIKEKGD